MKYQIVKRTYITELEKLVNQEINNGWKPIGGVSVGSDRSTTFSNCYAQAMIKED